MCAENSSFLKEGYQHLLLECIRRFGKETPEPEKEEQSPVSWLMPEKEKSLQFHGLCRKKRRNLSSLFNQSGNVLPVSWRKTTAPAACGEARTAVEKRNSVRDRKKSVRLPSLSETLYRYPRGNGAGSRQLRSSRLPLWAYVLRKFPFHRAAGDARGKPSRRAGYRDRHIRFVQKEIVAKFLGETRSILEEKENFFSQWNVCLIQCDSFVQDVTMIHSPKEWEAYRETITIKGRGGTDFRPVFQKVEELRKQHVFRNLKALIYFTDGDGIYPEQKPDYETAFVFVRQTEKMNLVPKWAKKLLTEECTL